jgi:hypothetical protein
MNGSTALSCFILFYLHKNKMSHSKRTAQWLFNTIFISFRQFLHQTYTTPSVVSSDVNSHFPQTGHKIFFFSSTHPLLERIPDINTASEAGGKQKGRNTFICI